MSRLLFLCLLFILCTFNRVHCSFEQTFGQQTRQTLCDIDSFSDIVKDFSCHVILYLSLLERELPNLLLHLLVLRKINNLFSQRNHRKHHSHHHYRLTPPAIEKSVGYSSSAITFLVLLCDVLSDTNRHQSSTLCTTHSTVLYTDGF